MEKAEGKMKEAYGALVGDEAKKAEGRALEGRALQRTIPSRGRGRAEGEDQASRGQGGRARARQAEGQGRPAWRRGRHPAEALGKHPSIVPAPNRREVSEADLGLPRQPLGR